jgi:cytochrome b561
LAFPQPDNAQYTRTAIVLHWVIALLIVANFVLGLTMVDLPLSPQKLKYFSYHKWTGITIWLIVMLRILWRLGHRPPPLPAAMPGWQRAAAHVSHFALYLLMFAIPISGWLYSSAAGKPVVYLGLVPLPDLVAPDKQLAERLELLHITLNFTLLGLVVLHLLAGLKHHFIDRDSVLARMLPIVKR